MAIDETAVSMVNTGQQKILDASAGAMTLASSFLTTLTEVTNSLAVIAPIREESTEINRLDPISVEIEVPTWYISPTWDASGPAEPEIIDVVVDIERAPDFTHSTPHIDIPETPEIEYGELPDDLDVDDISIPTMDHYTLPSAPSISNFSIPSPPSIQLPRFNGTLSLDDIIPYTDSFSYEEQEYTSVLKNELDSKLQNDVVNGGTGLSPAVEQAIWDRGYERDSILLEDEINRAIAVHNNKGYSLPAGVIVAQIRDIQAKFETLRADRNRDIIIKQAELAQANTIDAREKALRFIAMEIEHFNKVADRAFQVSRSVAEFGIALFNVQVARYNAQLERYKAEAQVFEVLIRAELSKIELYKAQLEGTKVSVEIQRQYIDVYNAQLASISTLMEIYKTKMTAANINAEIQRNKVSIFQAQIQAYESGLRAENIKLDVYRGQIEGEKLKLDVFKSQVDSFNARVLGYKTEVEAKQIETSILLEKNKTSVDVYRSLTETYRTQVQAILDNARIQSSNYTSRLDAYKTRLAVEEVNANLKLEQQKIDITLEESRLSRALKVSETNIRNFLDAANIKGATAQGGATIHASYASTIASAMQSLFTAAISSSEVT